MELPVQPRLWPHGHSQAWYLESHITRHAISTQEVFVECWRRRKGWGKFICLEQIGMDCIVFLILARDFELMASI